MKKRDSYKQNGRKSNNFEFESEDNFKIKRRKKIKSRNRVKKVKAYLGHDIDDLLEE